MFSVDGSCRHIPWNNSQQDVVVIIDDEYFG